MRYHIQSSFSGGELDPSLHERTTFDKYQTGLKTLRNATVGKTGRVTSRPGSKFHVATKVVNLQAGTFTADNTTDIMTMVGHNFSTGEKVQVSSTLTLPTGLTAATDYFVVVRSLDTFTLAPLLYYAIHTQQAINITTNGTGVLTITPSNPGLKTKQFLYSPPYSKYVIEGGHGYFRIHDTQAGTYIEDYWDFSEDDLDLVQCCPVGRHVYFSVFGKVVQKILLGDTNSSIFQLETRRVPVNNIYYDIPAPTQVGQTYTSTGYLVDYLFTGVSNDEESGASTPNIGFPSLPINPGESNVFDFTFGTPLPNGYVAQKIRAYRRPQNGTAYGFIGEGTTTQFIDYGQDADYTHQPPTLSGYHWTGDFTNNYPIYRKGRAIAYYQQRLVITEYSNELLIAGYKYAGDLEAIHASRPGHPNNFFRDYPLSSDSALQFKCGTTGKAEVLRLADYEGLTAFTTVGIYQSKGPLSPDNLAMQKVGNWVIEEKVPPLEIPGAILFIDKSTNTIRTLIFSNEAGGYPGDEVSVFSNHLFQNKKVKSWAYQDGDIPLIWAVMDDGTLNILTYQREQQMRGWSHHETDGLFESVTVVKDLNNKSIVYVLVNRGGTRYIEYFSQRFVDSFKDYVAMDASVTFKSELSNDGDIVINVTADSPGVWDGTLTLTAASAVFANTAGNGAVGTVFRFFDADKSAYDLTVTTFSSTTSVKVTPDLEFPSAEASGIKLYKTYTTLTGLSHLNGKSVSLMVDGYVLGSPNNDIEDYDVLTPSGGSLTIPDGRRGAIVHVGLPYTVDVETLDIDTVEQKPALLESKLVHKVYLKVYNTRGIYIGSKFPKNDKVDGMVDPETLTEDIEEGIVGNAAQEPVTKRYDIVTDNDWNNGGRICVRQVDPLPMEILSIIPDLSVVY